MEAKQNWRQTGLISISEFSSSQNLQDQVAQAAEALLREKNLPLPDFILRQVEESLRRAVEGQVNGAPDPASAAQAAAVQLRAYLADSAAAGETGLLSSRRWGFFLVQRRDNQPGAPLLLLDLYFYHD